MRYDIGVLEGDDIGLEVVPETVKVLKAAVAREAGLEVAFHPFPVGWSSYQRHGHALPPETVEGLRAMHGFVLGPIGHAAYPKGDPNLVNAHPILRKRFDLYANLRPTRSYAQLPSLHQGVDLLIVRENNEGFQPDRNMLAGSGEFQPTEESAFSIRVITRRGSERVARAAFEAAMRRRKRVTAIHKRTVFKLTDGLFMGCVERIARDYPEVALDDYQVDTFAMHLVMRPQAFDVVLCTNMFGDILSDEAAGLVGGLGMAPGLNVGDTQAMAQATHGSAPDIAGKGIANPYAMIVSGKMLLDWLGARHADERMLAAARRIDDAVTRVIAEGARLTRDLGGTSTTGEMGSAIADACGRV
ncbi:MAG: isocitrate/isopropylmalate dehydrogenase family protein [Chloroflexota bacterium]|nr:isocitrate/isopropylmalate dehydrogenase family protein [Chloroflexota bacterium]